MADDGLKLGVTAVHASGRRTYDPTSKMRLIERCLQPGASVARLALEHDVNANLPWKWVRPHRLARKERGVNTPPSTPAFIPVAIDRAANDIVSMPDRMVDLRSNEPGVRLSTSDESRSPSSRIKMSATLPNGVQLALECGDADALPAVIGALCNVQPCR